MKSIAYALNHTHFQKRAFFVLAVVVMLFLAVYMYFMTQTVWNVVARQNTVKTIHKLSSEVATLEASYMSLSSTLTLEHAHELGFLEVVSEDTLFVERPVPAVALR